MLVVSNDIKNAYNRYTTQRKPKIRVGNNEYFIQNMDLYADAYDEGNIVGNTIARTLQFDIDTQYVRGIDEFQLFDGIWTGEEYKYINLGTFKLFEEQGVDDFFSHITAYDQLIKFNEVYNSSLTTYPTTIYGLLQSICSQAGVTLGTQSIANGDKTLNGNVFVEGETLKDVLKAICQISGTFAMMSNDTLILKLQGSDSLTLSKYQLADPEYKRTTWKWNQVVLGMQDIIGEYVLRQDDEDVELNGVHRLVINNNPFVYTQELREQYIDDLFDVVKGFGYVSYEAEWEGLPYIELGDTLTIDGYESIVLRYQIKSPDGLNSMIQAPSIIDSVIDYVNNTDDINNKQRRTEYRVDKAEGTITQLTQETTNIRNNIDNNYYTITQTNELVQNASTGITNTFSEAGGNNVFRNTGLWFGPDRTTEEKEASSTDGKIEIDDGADNTLSDLKLYGNTSQETTTGKNLFKASNGTFTKKGVTVTINNSIITLNGTATANVYLVITSTEDRYTHTFSGNYTISKITSATTVGSALYGTDSGGTDRAFLTINDNASVKTQAINGTYTSIRVQLNIPSGATFNNTIVKLQLEQGSSATSWEPFTNGPSPNPDYPQEIKTVTGRQEISVSGKNLFDKARITNNSWLLANGSIASQNNFAVSDFIPIKGNTNYVLPALKTRRLKFYDKYKVPLTTSDWDIESSENNQVITTPNNARYVRLTFNLNSMSIDTYMFEEGTTSTEYEAFRGGNYEINLSALGKNKFNINTIIKGYELNANTGKAQELSTWWLSDYIIVKPNTSYTSSNVSSNTKCWYDENKTFISKNQSTTATSPTNAKYLRVNGTLSSLENNLQAQIEEGNSATTFEEYRQIELCKIGTYQDYIYKSNGTWYKHKVIGKVVLDGSETGWNASANYEGWYITISDIKIGNASDISASPIYCNYYKQRTRNTVISSDYGVATGANKNVTFRNQNYVGSSELNNFKNWLSTHNTEVYYILETPVEEEITDSELISQLNAIELVNGENNISSSSTSLQISQIFIKYRGE